MYFWQYKFIIKKCFLKQRAVNRKKGIKMKKIEEYVRNQMQEDLGYDQMSLKEYIDLFTDEPVNKAKVEAL